MNCPGLPQYARSLQAFSDLVTGGDAAVAPYTGNFLGGQMGALQTNFQCVCEALGATTFAALARAYSVHYPSREWDLNLFGAGFPELLMAQHNNPRAAERDWRLLAAIARVEYSIASAYYADDPPGAASGAVHSGEHGIASLLAADAALPTPWTSAAMQRRNPFADIPGALVFNREIVIYRQDLRVRVCQPGSGPARERCTAGAS